MADQNEDTMPVWYIGLHDPDNDAASAELLQNASVMAYRWFSGIC